MDYIDIVKTNLEEVSEGSLTAAYEILFSKNMGLITDGEGRSGYAGKIGFRDFGLLDDVEIHASDDVYARGKNIAQSFFNMGKYHEVLAYFGITSSGNTKHTYRNITKIINDFKPEKKMPDVNYIVLTSTPSSPIGKFIETNGGTLIFLRGKDAKDEKLEGHECRKNGLLGDIFETSAVMLTSAMTRARRKGVEPDRFYDYYLQMIGELDYTQSFINEMKSNPAFVKLVDCIADPYMELHTGGNGVSGVVAEMFANRAVHVRRLTKKRNVPEPYPGAEFIGDHIHVKKYGNAPPMIEDSFLVSYSLSGDGLPEDYLEEAHAVDAENFIITSKDGKASTKLNDESMIKYKNVIRIEDNIYPNACFVGTSALNIAIGRLVDEGILISDKELKKGHKRDKIF